MEFNKNYILLCIILLSGYLRATVVSFNGWNNTNKKIAIIGERHVNREPLNDEWGLADKDHNDIFHNHLAQWIRSNKKIGFLMESSPELVKQSQTLIEADRKFSSLLGEHYWGMSITLPLLADAKDYSWGAVNFINFDLRSKAITTSMKFVGQLYELLEQMEGNEESNAIKIISNKTIEFIFRNCLDITISKYINSVEQIIAICSEHNEDASKIIQFSNKAKELFKSNNDHDNTPIYQFFSDLILKDGLSNFMNLFNTLFQPISSLIANLGVRIELKKALINYDFVVIFCGKLHADHINNYLIKTSFTNELSIAKEVSLNDETDKILPIHEQHLSNEELDKCLQNFTSKVSTEELKHICTFCDSIEKTKGTYKRCSKCKKARYCSVKCQKLDWKEHKTHCRY